MCPHSYPLAHYGVILNINSMFTLAAGHGTAQYGMVRQAYF